MPADKGINGPHWDPKPDFSRTDRPGHTAGAVDHTDPDAIARCLLDDDPTYVAYELFENVDLYGEAVQAAREIVRKREVTYRLHVRELNDAKIRENTARRAEMRKQTRYIGRVIDMQSGLETVIESHTAQPARSFA